MGLRDRGASSPNAAPPEARAAGPDDASAEVTLNSPAYWDLTFYGRPIGGYLAVQIRLLPADCRRLAGGLVSTSSG